MLKLAIVFLVLSSFTFEGFAFSAKKVKGTVISHNQLKTDSTHINARKFNANAINKYRSDPSFKYVEVKTGMSLWDRFWSFLWRAWERFIQWLAGLFEKLFGSAKAGKRVALVVEVLLIAGAVFLIAYLIFKMVGIDLLKLFRKNKNTNEVPYSESVENIHEINFDEAIEGALTVKNYRLAVRLLYLRSLKQLSDKQLIAWKVDKTNTVYLNEITDLEQRRHFSIVTRLFEYVWYGDFPVDGKSFVNINATFQDFKNQLS